MKTNELRIGNYVKCDSIPEVGILKISVINKDFVNGCNIELIQPIPLTEEWLLKFGFKITKQTKEDNNIWTFLGSECKFELEEIINFHLYDNMCFGTQIKYVHTLQNLYFALTNEELKLENDPASRISKQNN